MPKADCPDCGGTGWRIIERGGISAADRCHCSGEAETAQFLDGSQIPENYREASFETFHLPRDNPMALRTLADAMLAVSSYARLFPDTPKPGLLLAGPPGTGKTHLAVAALRRIIAKGHEGLFFDYQNLLEQIRAGYNETLGASSREAYKNALEAGVLLLDDLGAHRITDWVEDTVTAIITYRCNHRMPLIATTNLMDPDIGGASIEKSAVPGARSFRVSLEERIGERARSRLFEMCRVVRMPSVGDFRVHSQRM